jgi:O-antigen/teichoic acid export membrane protein
VIGGILLTPVIIRSFIGIQYYNAQEIRMMRVFWVAFGVNCALKTPTANILSAIGQIRFNTVNSILSTLVQTVICWVLISRFGLSGAAYGLLCGYILSSVGGIVYLRYYCKRLIKRHETNVPEVEIEDQV